jgi:hypothetical protein
MNGGSDFTNEVPNIFKTNKRNDRSTMTDLETAGLMQTIHQPEIKFEILFMRANCNEGICPGLEPGFAGIATFAENKK